MEVNEILEKTLERMPFSFTSNQFAIKGKKFGLKQIDINSGVISAFLKVKCNRGDTLRSWVKNEKIYVVEDTNLQSAIKLLKKNGFKVLKQVTQFEEV
jgi:hypothetical protein